MTKPMEQVKPQGKSSNALWDDSPVTMFDELMALPNTPTVNVLSPWLPEEGLAMIYAKRGIGKTYLALAIAYAIATGGSLLGWQASKARSVLYIDGEMTLKSLAERLKALSKGDKCHRSGLPLGVINPDKLVGNAVPELKGTLKTAKTFSECQQILDQIIAKTKMIDLANLRDQARTLPWVEPYEVIIIDNISTLCPSTKENEADTWSPVQRWAVMMRSLGKTVLFVHHAGKSGAQRGTSKREDVLDTVMTLKPSLSLAADKNDNGEQGACFEVHFEKHRGFYGESTKPFKAELITGADGSHHWQYHRLEANPAEQIALLKAQGYSYQQIADQVGVSKSTVSRYLQNKGIG
ncbi:MAG: hypothetical protein K0R12_1373 [Gammaproteobacteria bacterium]|nr:hypothetical protein [Gammaproteobacteria bacterium]